MNDFNEGTALKKPNELIRKRYINPNNQVCKSNARQIAKDNNVAWGVE